MHDGEGWEVLELGEKRIGVEVALQVEENLDGTVGNMKVLDGGEV